MKDMFNCLLISMMLFTVTTHALDEDIATMRKAAEQGNAETQFTLGYKYAMGLGVPVDNAEAIHWYRRAAEQGHAKAQFGIAYMYDMGLGVPENDAEAVRWYRKSAEQGYVAAQFNLGFLYIKGEGVSEDYFEAVHWIQKSAEQGHSGGQHLLGLMYAEGKGVPEDSIVAYAWVSIAAAQDVEFAIKDKESISEGMTREEIAKAQNLSWILWEAYGPDGNLSSVKQARIKLQARQAIAKAERLQAAQKLGEQEARMAAQAERAATHALSAMAGRIRASIEANWRRPGTSLRGLKAVISLRVGRNGEVQNVRIVESSGDSRFDESVELAVQKASPLPIPKEPEYYEYIKEFRIEFNPDD